MQAVATDANVRHDVALLLRRVAFGGRPDELDAAAGAGYAATVDAVLAQLDGSDGGGDAVPVPAFSPLSPGAPPTDPAARQAADKKRNQEGADLERWWIARMVASTAPAREKLTLFWHGHFATSIEKVRSPGLMFRQNQLFRTAGAGRFDDLVHAVAKDPAMLIWLDAGTNNKAHANENFARELMELFTLGIGNYSEDDVREAARCFTGWRFDRRTQQFAVDPRQHDDGQKTVLGQTGPFDGDQLVNLVTHTPQCARFVAARVWSHYARPAALDDPVVSDLAAGFARDLDVRGLLRAVFLHPEFRSDATRAGLVKTPIEYVVATLRSLGLSGDDPRLHSVLMDLGQQPFAPPSVGGWPQNGYWLSTASALTRLQFATKVVEKADLHPVASVSPNDRPAAAARLLSIDGWSPATSTALASVSKDPAQLVALALVSPEWVLA